MPVPFEEPDIGGVASFPRWLGGLGEYDDWPYWDTPDQSLPRVEFGDSGPERPFILWLRVADCLDAQRLELWYAVCKPAL